MVHESIYRIRLLPAEQLELPPRITRGSVRLHVTSESLISGIWRLVSAVFIRESGFTPAKRDLLYKRMDEG